MTTENQPPLIELQNITKSFGPVHALRGVSMHVGYREVVGLVGDNGAGKSTLMKMITGAYQPDSGQIYVEGKPVRFTSPHESRNAGIEMVYQDLALAGNLTVAGNIYLGREPMHKSWGVLRLLNEGQMKEGARSLLERLKVEINSVLLRAENMSGGQRQAVAIARTMAFNAKLVIMDEPTAALAVKEVAKVLDLVRGLRENNVSVVLISHRLQDVFAVADRIYVLFEGIKVAELRTAETNMEEVIAYIVGSKGSVAEARAAA